MKNIKGTSSLHDHDLDLRLKFCTRAYDIGKRAFLLFYRRKISDIYMDIDKEVDIIEFYGSVRLHKALKYWTGHLR